MKKVHVYSVVFELSRLEDGVEHRTTFEIKVAADDVEQAIHHAKQVQKQPDPTPRAWENERRAEDYSILRTLSVERKSEVWI